jgi:multidrug efflux pump subunit AcrB
MLTVQYPDNEIKTLTDFEQIPLRSADGKQTTPLESLASIKQINTPTEVDHYQLRRSFDVYVMPKAEDLSHVSNDVQKVLAGLPAPHDLTVQIGGSVDDMHQSFKSFGIGFILAVVLVYLILMAQFASFSDPFIILLAVPPGVAGVILFLLVTGTTMNVMSLMGVIMMAGIAVSNSILIVEFVGTLRASGVPIRKAIVDACSMRLRPILMTSLATVLGIIPLALALEPGSEQYASLARAILGGLVSSGIITVFLVPAVYLLIHRKEVDAEAAAEVAHV